MTLISGMHFPTNREEPQNEHPDAIVKRGRANKWEIWPADS
jgi:hypothetical protein